MAPQGERIAVLIVGHAFFLLAAVPLTALIVGARAKKQNVPKMGVLGIFCLTFAAVFGGIQNAHRTLLYCFSTESDSVVFCYSVRILIHTKK